MSEASESSDATGDIGDTGQEPSKDYTRQLGVVESLVAITRQCPSGPVRVVAQNALDAIKNDASVMREQVYSVLSALQGWRGERASQVHASLNAFYEQGATDNNDQEG